MKSNVYVIEYNCEEKENLIKKRVIVFGTGKRYENNKSIVNRYANIIGFIDNNPDLWGKTKDSIVIYKPEDIFTLCYDCVVLEAVRAKEMKEQLLAMGVDKTKIKYHTEFYAEYAENEIKYYNNFGMNDNNENILFITNDLGYHGAAIAAVYATKALMKRGKNVLLIAASGDEKFIEEMTKQDIHIAIDEKIPYIGEYEKIWIKRFDFVIVNVFNLIRCAYEVSQIRPSFWWIHEAKDSFETTIDEFSEYFVADKMEKCNIVAVASIPQNNFNDYFKGMVKERLPYGIPDENNFKIDSNEKKDKTVFAIIGTCCQRKSQKICIDAFKMMSQEKRKEIELWVIGNVSNSLYCERLIEATKEEEEIKFMGVCSRKKMKEVFPKIDVLLCPSEEDPMPIVVTEAMMYGKVCVVSDMVGTSEYIIDGYNGFICKQGDVCELYYKLEYILENRDMISLIGKRGRDIYDKYFSMDIFADNLEKTMHRYGLK